MTAIPHGLEAWVERISEKELPAMTATVRALEQLEKSDTASLASLGRSVLHDHGLTTRILKVVNSAIYRRGQAQITTVSRASVILGYDALKHICITATMIDGLLRNRDLSPAVHERLIELMAGSLHAAMLARMLMAGYDEDTREEIYIAALLQNLGEIAFWSSGGPATETLDARLRAGAQPKAAVQELLGTSFDNLGASLARTWNMGDLLIRAITDPLRRSPEMRCVALAKGFSQALAKGDQGAVQKGLNDMAAFMKVEPDIAKARIQACTQATAELASCYGVGEVAQKLFPQGGWDPEEAPSLFHEPDEGLQLKMLREMMTLVGEKADINLLIHTTLEGLLRAVGMDRVMVLMPSPSFDRLNPRFFASTDQKPLRELLSLPLGGTDLFSKTFKDKEFLWVENLKDPAWAARLPRELATVNKGAPFFLAPLAVDHKCLGLFYADRAHSGRPLGREDFDAFSHFVRQASLCLNLLLRP
ncbi:HDOD domain-containing protein [Gallaecimonas kandeliae]|uniref:HDOD domain-containing protein n=1 Tax=Gallaecimonas kandeliae TaxID=3029055 RepID=UPI00264A07BE|nr:HDOD domain-containing protein [Gallaecimonas kandeliae]WKE65531.1 HDOD domain-containing protein [Gallaecimonas kandeliae]